MFFFTFGCLHFNIFAVIIYLRSLFVVGWVMRECLDYGRWGWWRVEWREGDDGFLVDFLVGG